MASPNSPLKRTNMNEPIPQGWDGTDWQAILVDPSGRLLATMTSGDPTGFESLSVSTVAVGLANIPSAANRAQITFEGGASRILISGGDPVAGVSGHLLQGGDALELSSRLELTNFRVVRDGGTDALLQVTYF